MKGLGTIVLGLIIMGVLTFIGISVDKLRGTDHTFAMAGMVAGFIITIMISNKLFDDSK